MKTILLALAMITTANAQETKKADITCTSTFGNNLFDSFTLETELTLWSDGASFRTPTAEVKADLCCGEETWTGKSPYIENDKNYNPRKYKGFVRMDLSNLVDTKDFGKYYPSDSCVIYVMVPLNGLDKKAKTLNLPVTINCDQGGGKEILSCKVGKITRD